MCVKPGANGFTFIEVHALILNSKQAESKTSIGFSKNITNFLWF